MKKPLGASGSRSGQSDKAEFNVRKVTKKYFSDQIGSR